MGFQQQIIAREDLLEASRVKSGAQGLDGGFFERFVRTRGDDPCAAAGFPHSETEIVSKRSPPRFPARRLVSGRTVLHAAGRLFALPMLLLLLMGWPSHAQTPAAKISGTVVDASGAPVQGAQILDRDGKLLGSTAADGSFTVPGGAATLDVVASHFAPKTVSVVGAGPLRATNTLASYGPLCYVS